MENPTIIMSVPPAPAEAEIPSSPVKTEMTVINCLICGSENTCSENRAKGATDTDTDNDHPEGQQEWTEAFCGIFNLNHPKICSIVSKSSYCEECHQKMKTIAKLKMDLYSKMKICCENMRIESNSASASTIASETISSSGISSQNQNQQEKRKRVFKYLDENQRNNQELVSNVIADPEFFHSSGARRGSGSATGTLDIVETASVKKDGVDGVDDDMDDIGSDSEENFDATLYLDNYMSEGESSGADAGEETDKSRFSRSKKFTDNTTPSKVSSVETNMKSFPTNTSFRKSKSAIGKTKKDPVLRKSTKGPGPDSGARRSKLKNNKSDPAVMESPGPSGGQGERDYKIEGSSSADSDSGSGSDDNYTPGHNSNSVHRNPSNSSSSKAKSRENTFSGFPNQSLGQFIPTKFSVKNRNKVENRLLWKKYTKQIARYGVKDLDIPVERIPDLEFDEIDDGRKGRKRIHCPVAGCSAVLFKKFKLVEHIKVVHQGIKSPYECLVCGKKFSRASEFKDHGNTHTGERPFACDFCPATFALRASLHGHTVNLHGEKRFQCDTCGKCYHARHPYELHLQAHKNERPCVCEVCGKSFKTPYALKIHQTLHPELNLNPLKCNICDKIFTSANGLKVHIMVHNGDLRFKCDLCDFRAPYLGRLKGHMLAQHSQGESPFECDTCHRKYKSPGILKHHKKHWCMKKPNELMCAECGKGFMNALTLRRHEKIHNGTKKTFLCSACGKEFFSKANLQRHFDHSHKEKEQQSESDKIDISNINSSICYNNFDLFQGLTQN